MANNRHSYNYYETSDRDHSGSRDILEPTFDGPDQYFMQTSTTPASKSYTPGIDRPLVAPKPVGRPPAMAPPLPPPYEVRYRYGDYRFSFEQACKNWTMRISALQIIFAFFALGIGISLVLLVHQKYWMYHCGIWVPLLYIVTCLVALLSVLRHRSQNLLVAALVLMILSLIGSAVLASFAVRQWLVDTVNIRGRLCVLPRYDSHWIRTVYYEGNDQQFVECGERLEEDIYSQKLAASFCALLGFLSITEGLLLLATVVTTMCQLCDCLSVGLSDYLPSFCRRSCCC